MPAATIDPIIQQAAQAFTESAGVSAIVLPGSGGPQNVSMQIDFPGGASLRLPVAVVPTIDRRSRLDPVAQDKDVLLVSTYLSAEMLGRCRELGIAAMDLSGNAYVKGGDGIVFISGHPRARSQAKGRHKAKAWTAKGLQVVFALLADARLLQATYRTIAEASNVSLGTVQQVVNDLIARGMAVRLDDLHLTLLSPSRLIDEWTMLYPARLRHSLGRFSAANPEWWKAIDIRQSGCQWGGEIAAAKLTGYLKPATATIHCHGAVPKSLIAQGRLRKDDAGPIEFVAAFADIPAPEGIPPDLVHPLLVYAELMASGDSRNIETARLIRDQYLAAHNP